MIVSTFTRGNDSGQFETISCYNDAPITFNGKLLLLFFRNERHINKLFSFGNISTLDYNKKTNRIEHETLLDIGEEIENCVPKFTDTIPTSTEEINYALVSGTWYVSVVGTKMFKRVTTVISECDDPNEYDDKFDVDIDWSNL